MTQPDEQLNKDRGYYRMLTNAELIRVAGEATRLTELEQVLAERLKIMERNITC